MAKKKDVQGSYFPSQAVSNDEKKSMEYGLKVAKAIESEWSTGDNGLGRYFQTRKEYHRLRLYARGEQSVRKYKDEFNISGDLSYLNLDWDPVPILPKFVDILVNGMQDRLFKIKAEGQDQVSVERRTKFVEDLEQDMYGKDFNESVKQQLGVDISNFPGQDIPRNQDELDLYMQLEYKTGIEIAIEQAVDNVFKKNEYERLKRRRDEDIVVLGIGALQHNYSDIDGIITRYVDPSDLIYSYTEEPDFSDCYYFGEVVRTSTVEVKKEFPWLSDAQMEAIMETGSKYGYHNYTTAESYDEFDKNTVNIMRFNWKTWEEDIHKVKKMPSGLEKATGKDHNFDPPPNDEYSKTSELREIFYEGVVILGTDILLKWEKGKNMVRPGSNTNKVHMNYVVTAPKMYKGRIESTVQRITSYADLIQLTHLKLQQTIQRMVPEGVYLDADGLAEIDLGNGTSYSPGEALAMYFQTGSVVGRSKTKMGDQNPGAIPIQPLPGSGGDHIEKLIVAYNHYLQMIRDVTGLNEARDASDPDTYSLVGLQKLAAANSNTATRHILQAGLQMDKKMADAICSRFKQVLEHHPNREGLIQSIGRFSVGSLKEMDGLHHHDFGIFLEIEPDEEEKQFIEANIQQALSSQSIELEDAIDVREIRNVKLANQLLKSRKQRKKEEDQEINERNIQAQAQANAEAANSAELAKAQAETIKAEAKIMIEKAKAETEVAKINVLADQKRELMDHEEQIDNNRAKRDFDYQKQIISLEGKADKSGSGKKFESKNDNLKGISFEEFDPK